MPVRLGSRLVLVAALFALAFVPGSMSGIGAATATTEPLDVALSYLDKNAAELGVTRADVTDLAVTSKYRSTHSGVTHVNLNQRFQELEVFGGHVTVNVAADGSVIFAGGSLVRALGAAPSGTVKLEPTAAVEAAADALDLEQPTDLRVISAARARRGRRSSPTAGSPTRLIPLRLGWQPTAGRAPQGVAARHRRFLGRQPLERDGRRRDRQAAQRRRLDDQGQRGRPRGDARAPEREQRPAERLRGAVATAITPNPVNDGSSYRVFELPKESPNDGPRTLVTNPADAKASPFGWHDTNGAAGPEFTTTQGNNAHAYLDQDNNNAMDFGGSPTAARASTSTSRPT